MELYKFIIFCTRIVVITRECPRIQLGLKYLDVPNSAPKEPIVRVTVIKALH